MGLSSITCADHPDYMSSQIQKITGRSTAIVLWPVFVLYELYYENEMLITSDVNHLWVPVTFGALTSYHT